MISKIWGFIEGVAVFWSSRISRCFKTWCSVYRRIKQTNTSILVPFDRHILHRMPCEIWRCGFHLSFERYGNSSQYGWVGNRKAYRFMALFISNPATSETKIVIFVSRPSRLFSFSSSHNLPPFTQKVCDRM